MRRGIILLSCFMLLLSWQGKADGFVKNEGQWKGPFLYKTDIAGGSIYLESDGFTFHFVDQQYNEQIHHRKPGVPENVHHHAFKIEFVGANKTPLVSSEKPYDHYFNYYLGNDDRRWKTEIHPVASVVYQDIYDGIDLKVEEHGGTLKYEFHVFPGADPDQIKMELIGLDETILQDNGDLVFKTSLGDVTELKPKVYQEYVKGNTDILQSSFHLDGNILTYEIEAHDTTEMLVIDPQILFSTYSGSSTDNWGFTAAPDQFGFLYAGGIVLGSGYPTTSGGYDESFNNGIYDIGLSKYDTSGTSLIFSTFLGGDNVEQPHSLIVDQSNNLIVMGTTGSDNFPTTSGAFDGSFGGGPPFALNSILNMDEGSDIFLCKFNSSGSTLLGSTFVGGTSNDGLNSADNLTYNYSDEFRGEVVLDEEGDIYVASSTTSSNFPSTTGSFDVNSNGNEDGVIFKMNASLTSLIWSGFLGGSGADACYGIDIADDGSIYVCGGTRSTNFPVHSTAYQTSYQDSTDAFIAHISADGSNILHATYYGTINYDQIFLIQMDKSNRPNFFGQTEHEGSQLISNALFNNVGGGQIVGILDADLEGTVWTTQFGSTPGQPNISPTALLVDVCNQIYLSGWGGSLNTVGGGDVSDVFGLPITNDAFQSSPDFAAADFYLCVISSDGNTLEFGSFFGGNSSQDHVDGGTSRFDRGGKIYHCVCASCGGFNDFPIEPDPGAWSETNGSGNCNNAVFKIDFELPLVLADFEPPPNACAPFTTTLNNNSIFQSATSYFWDFGNGTTSTGTNPSVTYNNKGIYTITLIVTDPTSCNGADTLQRSIQIFKDTNYFLPEIDTCIGRPVILGPDPAAYTNIGNATISWDPANLVSNANILNPSTVLSSSELFRLVIDYGGCQERILQQVNIDRYPISASEDTIICSDFTPFEVVGSAFGAASEFAWSDDPNFSNILTTDSVLQINELSNALNFFYFRTIKPNGCEMYDTLMITLSDLDMVLTPDTTVCKNADISITAASQNPKNTFSYYWTVDEYSTDPANFITDTLNKQIDTFLFEAETFYVIANSQKVKGCIARDSVRIDVSALDGSTVIAELSPDSIYRGQQVSLKGTPIEFTHYWYAVDAGTSGDSINGYIDSPTEPSTLARPKYGTSYIWVVSDEDNPQCTFDDTVTVVPYDIVCDTPEVFLPSAFSPNGDGVNDILFVRGRNVETVDLRIYDRWGDEVFHSEDQTVGWYGNVKGVPITFTTVFNYQLDVTCLGNIPYSTKGNITVLE